MSIHVLSAVFKHSQAKLGPRLVLIAIADRANDDGIAWPRIARLMADTNLSKRGVIYAVQRLAAMGEIEIVRPGTAEKHPVYRVLVGAKSAPVGRKDCTDQVQDLHSPVYEPSLEPSKEPNGAAEAARVWESWKRHHPAAKYTPDRQRLIIKWLPYYPAETLIAAVEGNHESPFHKGDNPQKKRYHDLGLILRNADHIEAFAELHEPSEERRDWSDEDWKRELRRLGAPV